ncbi:MAG: hypothetical protein HC912_05175 [Saprospiraceae bacterium]|nr:hypothetical protein [Saprospiraceae bacterium]
MPPRITGILPSIITPGDTMIINGNNFAGAKENMKVVVNKENLRIISATASQIKCIVPRYISGFNSEVVVTTITGEQTNPFPLTNISAPELFRLIPDVISPEDTVVIEGRFFSPTKEWNEIIVNGFLLNYQIVSATRNKIVFIPNDLPVAQGSKFIVKVGYQESTSELSFSVGVSTIDDFFPKQGTLGDTITIVGRNFRRSLFDNQVLFNNTLWETISAKPNELKVVVSEQFIGLSQSVTDKISVRVGSQVSTSQASFNYVNKDWRLVSELPLLSYRPKGFAIGQNLYYISDSETDWWRYRFDNQTWSRMSTIPRSSEANFNFVTELAISVGTEGFAMQRDLSSGVEFRFWRYLPASDSWIRINTNLPNNLAINNLYSAFAIDREVFILFSGRNNVNWKLNIDTGAWSPISDYANLVSPSGTVFPITATALGQKGYVVNASSGSNNRDLLTYDVANNRWSKVADYPFLSANPFANNAFAFNNNIYVLSFDRPLHVYEWNTTANKSRSYPLNAPPTDIEFGNGQYFIVNNKVFFAVGKYLYEWLPR